MKFSWSIFAVLVVVCHMSFALPSMRVKRDDKLSLDPTNVAEPSDDVNRDRRAFNPEASFQSKNAVLGFVFGASSASAHVVGTASRTAINRFSPTRPPLKTTTDDIPDLDRNRVSLDIPDKLFGSSFNTVTNVSKIIGDLMMNTSRRTAQFLWIFKPLFGNALKIEIPDPTTTTTEEPERL
ncbi:hypothetical protein ACKWTF_006138 [Chironomus riparius]